MWRFRQIHFQSCKSLSLFGRWLKQSGECFITFIQDASYKWNTRVNYVQNPSMGPWVTYDRSACVMQFLCKNSAWLVDMGTNICKRSVMAFVCSRIIRFYLFTIQRIALFKITFFQQLYSASAFYILGTTRHRSILYKIINQML